MKESTKITLRIIGMRLRFLGVRLLQLGGLGLMAFGAWLLFVEPGAGMHALMPENQAVAAVALMAVGAAVVWFSSGTHTTGLPRAMRE